MGLLDWKGSAWDRVLSVILIMAVLGALGYVMVTPATGERFTEFYMLGQEGEAADYPAELAVGEGEVLVGIVNQEGETMSYRVEVRIDGVKSNEVGPVVLEHKERWEEEVSFVPKVAGEKQKVEFLLYKQGQTEACQSLHLWVDVKD